MYTLALDFVADSDVVDAGCCAAANRLKRKMPRNANLLRSMMFSVMSFLGKMDRNSELKIACVKFCRQVTEVLSETHSGTGLQATTQRLPDPLGFARYHDIIATKRRVEFQWSFGQKPSS